MKSVPSSPGPYLGISVDESFAEISLVRDGRVLDSQRSFLPRENLRVALRKFLEKNRESSVDRIYVSLRFLEKILDYRLGGSVAQLVTEGFENWMQIRSKDPAAQSLSNPDLIFSIPERVSADGQVLKSVQESDLLQIEAKLRLMEVKRVCVHFLHAGLQPRNQNQVRDFFAARDFDVFTPPPSDEVDEVSRWRANTLNASVSGTFLEIQEDLHAACEGFMPVNNIFYLSAAKKLFQDENHRRLGSLFSTRAAQVEAHGKSSDLLYLGLEKFSWLRPLEESLWHSPWGEVELKHPVCIDLEIQPTSAIALNEFSDLDFSEKVEGFEPGPIFLGRGQRPTFLDLYAEEDLLKSMAGLADRISASACTKFKNALVAVAKGSSSKNSDAAVLIQGLRELAADRISMEVNLRSEKVKIMGPLAELLAPALIARNKNWSVEAEAFGDSRAVAIAGSTWQVIP